MIVLLDIEKAFNKSNTLYGKSFEETSDISQHNEGRLQQAHILHQHKMERN